MSNISTGDLLLKSSVDGGEIIIENDFFLMTDGFETATYISLFGGNFEDNGTESTKNKSWWGNQLENNEPSRLVISRTQSIIRGLPATPSNLKKVISAATQDLSWFKSDGICDTINVTGSLPSRNRLELNIELLKNGDKLDNFKFIENWGGMKNEKKVFVPVKPVVSAKFESIVTEDNFYFATSDGLVMSARKVEGVV